MIVRLVAFGAQTHRSTVVNTEYARGHSVNMTTTREVRAALVYIVFLPFSHFSGRFTGLSSLHRPKTLSVASVVVSNLHVVPLHSMSVPHPVIIIVVDGGARTAASGQLRLAICIAFHARGHPQRGGCGGVWWRPGHNYGVIYIESPKAEFVDGHDNARQ